jgi:UDP-3-O-[3-hydroxymyristoyl] glucosamine N-acyltransferase
MTRLEFAIQRRKDIFEGYSFIHPSVIVPWWVEIGHGVKIHAGVTLGSEGFSFEWDPESKEWLHIPHIGKLIIEDNVEIFEHCNLCRGTTEDTIIGKGSKIDSLCHIGHNDILGKGCILTSASIIGGSTILKDYVYIGLNTTVIQHITIAEGVFIGQGSNVVKDITEPWTVWAGNPARLLRERKGFEV